MTTLLFGIEEQGPEEYATVKTIDLIYFCMNRIQRQPSKLNRGPSVRTAKEQRDKDWKVHINPKRGVSLCNYQVMRGGRPREFDDYVILRGVLSLHYSLGKKRRGVSTEAEKQSHLGLNSGVSCMLYVGLAHPL